MRRTWALRALVFLSFLGAIRAESPISVCSAVDRRVDLTGRTISIRGEWLLGMEQSLLMPHRCRTSLSVDGLNWPISINLAFPDIPGMPDAQLRRTREAFERAGLEMRRRRARGNKGKIIITVTGRLRSKPLRILVHERHEPIYLGFGHLGGAPAEMLVFDIPKIVVLRD